MKITRIRILKTPLPHVGGACVRGAGNAIEAEIASVMMIDTDAGVQGCEEFTPCGENNMVARIDAIMDHTVQGHGYAKAPFDAACWDILGQTCDQPVHRHRRPGGAGRHALRPRRARSGCHPGFREPRRIRRKLRRRNMRNWECQCNLEGHSNCAWDLRHLPRDTSDLCAILAEGGGHDPHSLGNKTISNRLQEPSCFTLRRVFLMCNCDFASSCSFDSCSNYTIMSPSSTPFPRRIA